jgi:hypothetical protein
MASFNLVNHAANVSYLATTSCPRVDAVSSEERNRTAITILLQ